MSGQSKKVLKRVFLLREEDIQKAESKIVLAMAPYMMMYARVLENSLLNKTKAAGATVGGRRLKQVARHITAKNKNA
ncbi:MAG TPA: hypothetical protein VGS11_09795 [Candidatus Bathyarchaeia archaeon]|nr:hypothetical protein [Candidatus Bathyarchaeia archaeon]